MEACVCPGPLLTFNSAVTVQAQAVCGVAHAAAVATDTANSNTSAVDALEAAGLNPHVAVDHLDTALGWLQPISFHATFLLQSSGQRGHVQAHNHKRSHSLPEPQEQPGLAGDLAGGKAPAMGATPTTNVK